MLLKSSLPRRNGTTYLVEAENGMLYRVPEDKLESWEKADHSAPLNKAERQLVDRLLREIYSSRK